MFATNPLTPAGPHNYRKRRPSFPIKEEEQEQQRYQKKQRQKDYDDDSTITKKVCPKLRHYIPPPNEKLKPSDWGPGAWLMLHHVIGRFNTIIHPADYFTNPSLCDDQTWNVMTYLDKMKKVLPGRKCRSNLENELSMLFANKNETDYNVDAGTLINVLHNRVNQRLGKKVITEMEARQTEVPVSTLFWPQSMRNAIYKFRTLVNSAHNGNPRPRKREMKTKPKDVVAVDDDHDKENTPSRQGKQMMEDDEQTKTTTTPMMVDDDIDDLDADDILERFDAFERYKDFMHKDDDNSNVSSSDQTDYLTVSAWHRHLIDVVHTPGQHAIFIFSNNNLLQFSTDYDFLVYNSLTDSFTFISFPFEKFEFTSYQLFNYTYKIPPAFIDNNNNGQRPHDSNPTSLCQNGVVFYSSDSVLLFFLDINIFVSYRTTMFKYNKETLNYIMKESTNPFSIVTDAGVSVPLNECVQINKLETDKDRSVVSYSLPMFIHDKHKDYRNDNFKFKFNVDDNFHLQVSYEIDKSAETAIQMENVNVPIIIHYSFRLNNTEFLRVTKNVQEIRKNSIQCLQTKRNVQFRDFYLHIIRHYPLPIFLFFNPWCNSFRIEYLNQTSLSTDTVNYVKQILSCWQ